MEFELPKNVEYILSRYEETGYEAHCVGGCVRDRLMGLSPQDYDIATNAPCEVTMELFSKVIPTGIKHGTVTVVIDDENYEITRYRIDGEYHDHRRPESVEFTDDFKLDLSRRDFTVNAMGYNSKLGLCDPFGGKEDINNGIIRTVGEPDKRFSEDALRMLRGIRFSSRLGFEIEQKTLDSITKNAHTLCEVSAERIAVELLKTLEGKTPSLVSKIINAKGLESFGLKVCGETEALDRLPCSPLLRLAALTLLCKADIKSVCNRLKLSNMQKSQALANHQIIGRENLRLEFIKPRITELGYEGCAEAIRSYGILNDTDPSPLLDALENARINGHPYCLEMLALKGGDIKALGFEGEEISKIQSRLLDEVLRNPNLNEPEKLYNILSVYFN